MARARRNDRSPDEPVPGSGRHYDDDTATPGRGPGSPPDTYQEDDIINVPLPPGQSGGDSEGAGDRD